MKITEKLKARFFAKVDSDPETGDCHEWLGAS